MIARRKCEEVFLKKWFYKTIKNGDRVSRSCLLYSKLECGLYCFCCKLFRLGNDHYLFVAKGGTFRLAPGRHFPMSGPWKWSSKTKDHTMVDQARWRHKYNITARAGGRHFLLGPGAPDCAPTPLPTSMHLWIRKKQKAQNRTLGDPSNNWLHRWFTVSPTYCFLLERYDFVSFNTFPLTP